MINRKTLEKARDWARSTTGVAMTEVRAAEEVIESLPDSWIDADKLRAVLEEWEYEPADPAHAHKFFRAVEALLPAPRTMDEIEWDDEHQGLEAVYQAGSRWESVVRMLCPMEHNGHDGIVCVEKSGRVFVPYLRDLTPLPGTQIDLTPTSTIEDKPAPKPASPRPEDVPVGEPWQVEVDGQAAIGYRSDSEARLCWAVVYRDDFGHAWLYDRDVTLIARLAPETTEQDDVPVFDTAYTYSDKDGEEWEYLDGRWVTDDTHTGRVAKRKVSFGLDSLPAEYGPYTIKEEAGDK